MTKIENWLDISGYEGMYQVSNLGNIRSLPRKVKIHNGAYRLVRGRALSQSTDDRGYSSVSLWKDNKGKTHRVHSLVVHAFMRKDYHGLVVNHINGIKTDNEVWNLELVTQQENVTHAFSMNLAKGTNTGSFGANHNNSKCGRIIMPCGDLLIFKSQADVVREFGLGQSKVSMLARGKLKEHKGWRCFNKVALGVITGDEAREIVMKAIRKA